ncbi:MAG: OmpA family protein [Bacteroidota bacterium]
MFVFEGDKPIFDRGFMFPNRTIILSTLILLLSFCSLQGQTAEQPWAISLGGGVISYKQVAGQPNFPFTYYDPAFQVAANRYLSGGFDLRAHLLVSPQARHPGFYESGASHLLTDFNYSMVFKLNNGVLLRENAFFAPYFLVGIGGSYLQGHPDTYIPYGIGARFRLGQRTAIRVETVRKSSLNKDYQHVANAIAFVYNLNSPGEDRPELPQEVEEELMITSLLPQDRDQDGLIDLDDECPDEAGPIHSVGCPVEQEMSKAQPALVSDPQAPTDDPSIDLTQPEEKQEQKTKAVPPKETQPIVNQPQNQPAPQNEASEEKTDWATSSDVASGEAYEVDSSKTLVYWNDDIDLTPAGEKSSATDYLSYAGTRPEEKNDVDKKNTTEVARTHPSPTTNAFQYNSQLENQTEEVMSMPCGTGKVDKVGPIFFEYGSDELDPYVKAKLDNLADLLKSCDNSKLVLEGHTDDVGSMDDNLILSVMRAYNVKYYLVYKHGISQKRITSQGLGETAPVADNTTQTGREKNRRVDFQIMF